MYREEDIEGIHMVRGAVNNLVHNEHKKIVVIGCGRSGTLYMSMLFRKLGFEVGHEGFLADGISSWYVGEKSRAVVVKSVMRNLDTVYVHLLRNPMDAIASMWRCELLPNRAALDFFRRSNPEFNHLSNTPAHVARYWITWNKNIEDFYGGPNLFRLNIESLQTSKGIEDFCRYVGIEESGLVRDTIQGLGENVHTLDRESIKALNMMYRGNIPNIDLEDVVLHDQKTALELIVAAEAYGYSFYNIDEGRRENTSHWKQE